LLLATAAVQVGSPTESWENLARTLQRQPGLLAVRQADGMVVDLAASPDGALIDASRPSEGAGPRPPLLLDAGTHEALAFPEAPPASGIAFSPDSTLLAMAVNQWNGDGPPRLDAQPVRLYEMPGGTLAERQLGGFVPGDSVVELPTKRPRAPPAPRRRHPLRSHPGRRGPARRSRHR
jgi:hypothetical protein